jgi:Na+/H+ antiporter NhaC
LFIDKTKYFKGIIRSQLKKLLTILTNYKKDTATYNFYLYRSIFLLMVYKSLKISIILIVFFLISFINAKAFAQNAEEYFFNYDIEIPAVIIEGIENEIKISFDQSFTGEILVLINQEEHILDVDKGEAYFIKTFNDQEIMRVEIGQIVKEKRVNPVPLWFSIFPPLLAIFMALIFREVISSLFIGIFSGAAVMFIYTEGLLGVFPAFLSVLDTYVLDALVDKDHISVIVFSMIIGAMVTIISKNGGMKGVVDNISKYAKNERSGQLSTYFLGLIIFFDDYANTLVVGNTMRPVTDRLKISREKLSYIVDSTAAPIAAIAFVTTWIGAQLGYIKDSIVSIEGLNESAYSIFINSLQFAFYPIFTLAFMLMLILMAKDFGPMLKAERRAKKKGEVARIIKDDEEKIHEEISSLEPVMGKKHHWANAVIPVLVVIFGTIAGLIYTGMETMSWEQASMNDSTTSSLRRLSNIVGNADSYRSLLWSSISGLAVAILLTLLQKIMNLHQTMDAMMRGFKTMLGAIMILILAWSLAKVTEHMHTADFITGLLLSIDLHPALVPAITFVLAAIVAFSTGSSWGTMAILYPLMLPASWHLSMESGLSHDQTLMIFYNVVSTVLAGSVLGDHCSPISDTTILSSLATSCNHIDHVKTQLPYALTVGGVSVFFGTIPGALGISSLIAFPIGFIILYLIIRFFGKKI